MRLLIFTQKIDSKDPVLGFFHGWLEHFSYRFESVEVICLEKGDFFLPKNVNVFSLGKEDGSSKIKYLINFYKILKDLKGRYDKVFIHMNEEYAILGGIYWRFNKIPVYLWRNHPSGNLFTYLAVLFSTKVFCTSPQSFTSQFKKTVIMPVGVDTKVFKSKSLSRKKYSVCMVGRISKVKNIDLGIKAIEKLHLDGVQASLSIIGPTLPKDENYLMELKEYVKENNLSTVVSFLDSVPPQNLPEVYSSYQICLNLTESGSFDKTIIEAASCGTVPLVSNTSLKEMLPKVCFTDKNRDSIAEGVKNLLDDYVRISIEKDLASFVESQSFDSLIKKLEIELK